MRKIVLPILIAFAALFAAFGLAAVARDASVSSGTDTAVDWAALHRPLKISRLKAGSRCPISPSRRYGYGSADRLFGTEPVFLLVGAIVASGREGVDIGLSWRDTQGWRGAKTPWEVRSAYDGPILIRGARIDRKGAVAFGDPPGPSGAVGARQREARWPAGVDSDERSEYRGLALGTNFRSPGCYAFQADGRSFSRTIVIRVTDEMRPPGSRG